MRIRAATQDVSVGSGSSLGRLGTCALQVLTRSAICNVLGTIKPNVSFPVAPLFCVGQSVCVCVVAGGGLWAETARVQALA